eukprot:scaffold881_cov123-Isochrysis_galbana.AAC.9
MPTQAQTRNQLNIERAAHDETAEKMVQTQHDLGVNALSVCGPGRVRVGQSSACALTPPTH